MSIYWLALSTFILFLSTQIGNPVLPALSAQLGASPQITAGVLSAPLMTLVLLQFFSGALADRYGRRTVLVLGATLGGLSSLLCAVTKTWPALLALRILGGVADAIALPALLGFTAETAEGRHGLFFGALRSSQGLSFIVAPAIGGWLSLFSLRAPFLADGLLSLVAALAFGYGVSGGKSVRDEYHHHGQLKHLKALFTDRRVWAFALFGAVDNFAYPILAALLPIKAQLSGYVPWQISLLLSLEALGFTLSAFLTGYLSDRWGRKPFVIVAQPAIIVACIGLALSAQLSWLIFWYFIFGMFAAMTFLSATTMMADIAPREGAATVMGAFDSAIDLVLFASSTLGLALYGATRQLNLILVFAALPALVALPIALTTTETMSRSEKQICI